MNVYDFAPDLDLSKEGEGSIFGVKGIEGSDGIVYAKVVSCVEKCLLSRSVSCIDGDWICQAAIEGE